MTNQAANGNHTDNGTPRGFSTLTPFLAVRRAGQAVEFYADVFGARIAGTTEYPGEDGSMIVAHAELQFGNGRLQVGEANPEYHLVAPPDGDDVSFSIALYCPDVDATVERAIAAGATVREPLADFVSGDRFASIRDPFGIRWTVLTRVEDLSEEESNRRVEQWAASLAES